MIFVTGDTHGDVDLAKLKTNFMGDLSLTKKDYVIILGDFGLLFNNKSSKNETSLLNWYNAQSWTTLFIDGNHENFTRLFNLPVCNMFKNIVGKVSDSVYYLKRSQVYNIDNKTFFVMGGAESIDKEYRITEVSWWKEELPSYKEMEDGLLNLEKVGNKVDYVLTHTCPYSILIHKDLNLSPNERVFFTLEHYLEVVSNKVSFKQWYFGHLHQDVLNINNKYNSLFNKVILL